ncbi:MAG TPA: chemotaxis protein CheW [Oscillospiraceae bacterium]|nr:chemotaxis protein CheW [Oscillospiraceae bacterium]
MQTSTTLNATASKTNVSQMSGKYLTFWTDHQLFGVPISDVVQIIGIQEITPIPELPNYAKGVIDLRGSIIPVIDVRIRFGKEETKYDERTCIIVTNIENAHIGFIVDAVDEVTNIDDDAISPPPKVSHDSTNAYLTGISKVENRVVLLLDTGKILTESEFEQVSQQATTAASDFVNKE